MKAIIYTSNAGSTAQYAQLLANELHLPVYSAKKQRKKYLLIQRSFILAGSWQAGSKAIKIW